MDTRKSYILPPKVQQTLHDGLHLKDSVDGRADGICIHLHLAGNRGGSIDLSGCFNFHLPQGIGVTRDRKRCLGVNLDGSVRKNSVKKSGQC